ncbi:MAG: exopolysaccharide biosynthesis polyprenyl glycosylphosphotransferase [Lachnospiraceae bacterium]|nr:exopolysaccharide biosynthesis polyprenyl glycosylphosphotransferase [Lachnospiraceae bacterium]
MKKQKTLQRFSHSLLALTRAAAFLAAALPYFLIMGQRYFPLLNLSRTLAVTALAFLMAYIFMGRVYGGFDIGKRKSKPIIYSQVAALLFTDLIAQLFLSIMLSNETSDNRFRVANLWFMLLSYAVQILLLIILTYALNALYFKVHAPSKCLVVSKEGTDIQSFLKEIGKFQKQFQVMAAADWQDPDLEQSIYQNDIIFFYGLTPAERARGVLYAYRKKKDIYYSMELTDIVALRSETVYFSDKSMIASPERYMTFEQRCIKRGMDLVLASFALVLLSPVFLLTALAIKLEDGGPVFYRQERVTFGGRIFEVLKFRSMRAEEGEKHVSVSKDDDRITKVGRFIRKYRIDEFPQLINIIKSDMSIVGPRPEMVENVEKYTAEYPEFVYRERAKAGLTGMAQIYGKYNTSPKDKLMLDLSYIEQFSIWLDLKLMFRTVLVLFTPDESTEAFAEDQSSSADALTAELTADKAKEAADE